MTSMANSFFFSIATSSFGGRCQNVIRPRQVLVFRKLLAGSDGMAARGRESGGEMAFVMMMMNQRERRGNLDPFAGACKDIDGMRGFNWVLVTSRCLSLGAVRLGLQEG